jgi:putative SOS response-associated peptidase YedK
MCGRFTLTARDIDEAARVFGAEVAREYANLYRPRWNVAPTDGH